MSLPNGTSGYQVGAGNFSEPLLTPQAAPVAFTGTTATLTTQNLVNGLITSTQTAGVTLTLPTAALMNADFAGAKVNSAFDFTVINLGSSSGAVTMAPGTGFTIVGATGVPIATSARFRARKSADNAWVAYRV